MHGTSFTSWAPMAGPGALRPLVQEFANHLADLGHTRLTVSNYADAARHFAAWLDRAGIAPAALGHETIPHFDLFLGRTTPMGIRPLEQFLIALPAL